jgi:hypothetical protein
MVEFFTLILLASSANQSIKCIPQFGEKNKDAQSPSPLFSHNFARRAGLHKRKSIPLTKIEQAMSHITQKASFCNSNLRQLSKKVVKVLWIRISVFPARMGLRLVVDVVPNHAVVHA